MSSRYPVIKYRNDIRRETELPENYTLRHIGTPEPDIECIYVLKNDIIEFFLQMNADERYKDSNTNYENRPNYEFYRDEDSDPFYSCKRIDTAKRKWFDLIESEIDTL